jgi:hypothetical protein
MMLRSAWRFGDLTCLFRQTRRATEDAPFLIVPIERAREHPRCRRLKTIHLIHSDRGDT